MARSRAPQAWLMGHALTKRAACCSIRSPPDSLSSDASSPAPPQTEMASTRSRPPSTSSTSSTRLDSCCATALAIQTDSPCSGACSAVSALPSTAFDPGTFGLPPITTADRRQQGAVRNGYPNAAFEGGMNPWKLSGSLGASYVSEPGLNGSRSLHNRSTSSFEVETSQTLALENGIYVARIWAFTAPKGGAATVEWTPHIGRRCPA
jgi:hypothetical protein